MDFRGLLKRYPMLKVNVFLSTLAFLANGILFLGFVFPEMNRKAESARQWEKSRQDLARLNVLQQAEEGLREWKGLFPPKKDFSKIVSSLSDIAKKNRLDIPSIAYQQEDLDLGEISKVSFSFSVTGRYDRIRKFLYAIETSSEFWVIDDLMIEKPEKKEDNLVSAQMKLSAFLVRMGDV